MFTQVQRESILELAILGMYCDDRISLKEDDQISRIFSALGWEFDYPRDVFLMQTIGKMARFNEAFSERLIGDLVVHFPDDESRIKANKFVEDLLNVDGIEPEEVEFIRLFRKYFPAEQSVPLDI